MSEDQKNQSPPTNKTTRGDKALLNEEMVTGLDESEELEGGYKAPNRKKPPSTGSVKKPKIDK